MRGEFRDQGGLFSYIDPESRIPADHPLRRVRGLVRAVLKDLSGNFSRLYSHVPRLRRPTRKLPPCRTGCAQRRARIRPQ
jgi:hypothetical protein